MNPTVQTLTAARALIEPPGSWCQETDARDADERTVSCFSPSAVCWCAAGAIHKVATQTSGLDAALRIFRTVCGGNATKFNDDPATTHAMMLDAFDAAIEKAKSE